jgi:hypothetical protein
MGLGLYSTEGVEGVFSEVRECSANFDLTEF